MEENNVEEGSTINLSLQFETKKKVETKNGELMNQNLHKLHNERKLWKLEGRNALCWPFFCINDCQPMNLDHLQLIRCF
jgi:hypothetical protein